MAAKKSKKAVTAAKKKAPKKSVKASKKPGKLGARPLNPNTLPPQGLPVSAGASLDGGATGIGSAFFIRQAFTAGGGGADDVTVYAGLPFPCRVVDATMLVATAVMSATATLRTAAAGAGTALTDAMSAGTAGRVRTAGTSPTATTALAGGSSLFLRRSDNTTAGEIILSVVRTG